MFKSPIFILVLTTALVNAAEWNYVNQGSDWTGTCATGTKQSPVDVATSISAAPSYNTQVSDYGNYTSFAVVQNGHSIQVTPAGVADFLTIDTEVYNLKQYDFHAMSEHKLDGSQKDMESQFLFVNTKNVSKLAVVSFLFQSVATGTSTIVNIPGITALSKMGLTTTTPTTATNSTDQSLDMLTNLLDTVETFKSKLFTYDGSLTTPLCTEDVRWYVYGSPIILDEAVYTPLKTATHYTNTKGNYREIATIKGGNTNTKYLTTFTRNKSAPGNAQGNALSAVSAVIVFISSFLFLV